MVYKLTLYSVYFIQGEILAFSISGCLSEESLILYGTEVGKWKAVFWVYGVIGIAWSPFWVILAAEHPEDCDTSPEEMALLMRGELV